MPEDNLKIASVSLLIAISLGLVMLWNPFSCSSEKDPYRRSKLEKNLQNVIIQTQTPKIHISKEYILKMQRKGPGNYYDPSTDMDYIINMKNLTVISGTPREPDYLSPKTF